MEIVRRAWADTQAKHSWISQLIISAVAGFLCWLLLPEDQAMGEIKSIAIAVYSALVIWPVLEFIWNLILAPYRLLKDKYNKAIEKIEKYESSATKEILKFNKKQYDVTLYGNKHVLDESVQIFYIESKNEFFSSPFSVPCPPNSLVELGYNMRYGEGTPAYGLRGQASLSLARPGCNKNPYLLDSGRITVRVDETCQVEALVENKLGYVMSLEIDLISWETYGDRQIHFP